MLTLYGRAASSDAMEAIRPLEELDPLCEHVDVGGPFGGIDTPE